jgi:hypothetical protein
MRRRAGRHHKDIPGRFGGVETERAAGGPNRIASGFSEGRLHLGRDLAPKGLGLGFPGGEDQGVHAVLGHDIYLLRSA